MNNHDKMYCHRNSVEILKGYILTCWNVEGVHSHLSEYWKGTW